jgi:triacylglycerol lipase
MKPIVLIHGFGGGAYEFKPIIRFLKKNRVIKCYEFTYNQKFGQVSLKSISEEFSAFIKKNVAEKEFYIIGISQGGIIARYYIQNSKDRKIRKCITVCTPHKGSLLAYLSWKPGFLDLRPGSKLLTELNKKKDTTRYFCVYNPLDLMVFPGTNAILDKAAENKRVISLAHPLTFWAKPTLCFILKKLE